MVTVNDICKITGRKKAAVSRFLSRNHIQGQYTTGKSKHYDESYGILAAYMGKSGESATAVGMENLRTLNKSRDWNMTKQTEKEIHAYIDDLCRREFFGEVTLYFQGGNIGNVRETARLGKSDIITRYKDNVECTISENKKRVFIAHLSKRDKD